jgi:hypothetical protein
MIRLPRIRPMTLVLAALVLGLAPGSISAQQSWHIEEFHTDLEIETSGVTNVTETIRFRFDGDWNGIYRDLLLTAPAVYGRRDLLDVELVSITDDAGQPLRFETSSQGRRTRRWQVWIPGAQNASKTVVIRYVIHDGIGFYGQPGKDNYLDEIYWNVTGNEWTVRIESVSARVILPDGIEPVESAAYTGRGDETARSAQIETDANIVTFSESRVLNPGENMTVATSWRGGIVARIEPPSMVQRGTGAAWPLTIPAFAFFVAFRQWDRKGRDPEARPITVQYEPPESLTPAEVGTLVDHNAEMHDITATLVDLAVRGYIHIEKDEKKVLGLFSTSDYVFHLKRQHGDWADLEPHEAAYLSALFKYSDKGRSSGRGLLSTVFGRDEPPDLERSGEGPGQTWGSVRLSSLKERFYKDLPGIKKSIYSQLITKGHYRTHPGTAKAIWMVSGMMVIGLSVFAFSLANSGVILFADPMILGGAGIAAGLILVVFGQLMPARTIRGARAREHALGFKEFLSRVEEDRFKRMITSPEQFEKFLPFAMAFRVEDRWAKAFTEMFREPPDWYSGHYGGTFQATAFSRDMRSMSTAAASTMSSSPSGSSGGGSSGGGGGGGGGGAF